MKLTIELEIDSVGEAARIVESQRKVAKHSKAIWKSKQSRKQLLQSFHEDFDSFVDFVCAAERLSKYLQYVAEADLEQGKPRE